MNKRKKQKCECYKNEDKQNEKGTGRIHGGQTE
jgi:hypothetical protein